MPFPPRLADVLVAFASLFVIAGALAATNQPATSPAKAETLAFGGTTYVHRWSKNGQNEYTPTNDKDLSRWNDMVTINVHESVRNGEQHGRVGQWGSG
jgi:hypothetical protein